MLLFLKNVLPAEMRATEVLKVRSSRTLKLTASRMYEQQGHKQCVMARPTSREERATLPSEDRKTTHSSHLYL
jgi:hypothetical protein